MDASSKADDSGLSAERWVTDGNFRLRVLTFEQITHRHVRAMSLKSLLVFLHQAEGVQVVPVRSVPVCSRSVGQDEDTDGGHQQGAAESLL